MPRATTPGQGTLVAPWYELPPRPTPLAASDAAAGRSPVLLRWIVLGTGLALVCLLSLSRGPVAEPPAAPPRAEVVVQASSFASIDSTLGMAVAEAQLAALRAHDVALRAFAVQQAARYDELRAELRQLAGRLDTVAPSGAIAAPAAEDEQLRSLHDAGGPQFDRTYVRQALALNRELLAKLDAALATIEDVELRDALQEMRGTLGATMPVGAAGTSTTGSGRGSNH